MNPNERVYAAISGKVPDRVPVAPKIWVDLAANITGTSLHDVITSPDVALEVIAKAGIELGLDAVRQFHFPKKNIEIKDDEVLEVDKTGKAIGKIDMNGGLGTHLFDVGDYNVEDPYTMAYHHFWSSEEPIIKNIDDAKKIAVPDKKFLNEIGWGKRQKKIMEYANDRICLIGDCSSATLAFYVCLRGMDNAMFDLIEKPHMIHATMEKGVAIAVEKGKFNIDLGINILRLNDSVANMMVISPNHWREFIKPHMKEVCDELHSYSKDVKIYCHICGNVLPIIDDLVETGLDCIGPLDPMGGFTSKQVRERVGDSIALMGGVNTMSFVDSSEEEIRKEAQIVMTEAGMNGGFVLGSGCVVPRSAKRENLTALVDATNKFGKYKNGVLIND